MPSNPPTVRQKRLGAELRKLREAAGMSGEEAAVALECGQAKISRIETGTNGIRPFELRGLLQAYGVTDPELVEALVEMVKDGRRKGWWNNYGAALPGIADLAHLESQAVSICAWQTVLLPGLVQTPDYMRALFKQGKFSDSDAGIDKSVEGRLARQDVLTKPDGPAYWVILFEAALRVPVGGAKVMSNQLEHLAGLAERDRVSVQVMPYGAGAHGGLDGPFVIFGLPVPGMDVILADSVASPVYLENDGDIQRFRTLFDQLRASALGPVPSLDLIKRVARQL